MRTTPPSGAGSVTSTIPPAGGGSVTSSPRQSLYPLTQAQALAYLDAGIAVAGSLSGGREGLAQKTTETTYESKQVLKNVCAYEYDSYEKKNVYRCKDRYVTESVPTTKTVFKVSNGVVPRTFSTALGAIGDIAAAGATTWRRA